MTFFTAQNLFHLGMRELCLSKLKKIKVPMRGEPPRQRGAVLVPLCVTNDEVSLLFTLRTSKLNRSGQIAYPGGKSCLGETPEQTALRITQEDIGLRTNKIEVWGYGPAFPGRNNNVLITPVIAQINDISNDDLNISQDEVKEVFAISLKCLCDRNNQFHTQYQNGFILPVFNVEGYKIWGLTAYITHVFLQSLLPPDVYKNNWITKKVLSSTVQPEATETNQTMST